jgi:GH15 family glucan-1,4-alpha-glucosidase
MLGEQFDEEKKVWVSAMPLVSSEAAYVRTAHALYGQKLDTRDVTLSR